MKKTITVLWRRPPRQTKLPVQESQLVLPRRHHECAKIKIYTNLRIYRLTFMYPLFSGSLGNDTENEKAQQ